MRESFLSGNIGKDPEVFTPEGSEWSCISFSIANNEESKKISEGNYENITSWFDLEYWTKKPQEWLQKLTKGKKVICHCKAKQQVWQDKDTQKQRSKIVFVVEKWPEEGKSSEGHQPSSQPPQGNNSYRPSGNNQGNNDFNDRGEYRGNDFNGRPGYNNNNQNNNYNR